MSIFDHPDLVATVPTWRCPHCRTLQPEATRCWACKQAAATCSTCHLFRPSVATDLGYCVADSTRAPLRGDEVRECWQVAPAAALGGSGLFDDLEVAPAVPASAPHTSVPPDRAIPRVDELAGPAWCDVDPPGRLVEAPHVAPGRQPMSEVQRRLRRSREG